MPSIKEIQRQLAEFNRAAGRAESPEAFSAAWKRIFHRDLSAAAAKSFERYYKEMRSKRSTQRRSKTMRRHRQKQHGGDPAPVHYQTVPGLLTNTYGSYPVEVDTDPASLDALSGGVYPPNMSIPLSPAGFWPKVPADMGSNKVGGARRRRARSTRRRGQKQQRRRATRRRRQQRGGNLLDSLAMRPIPYISTAPPNFAQTLTHNISGGTQTIPAPPSPVNYTWALRGTTGASIDPGQVTPISSDFSKLASPAPWQTTN
jgi:hypothetical protein